MATPPYTKKDYTQVIKEVYDEENRKLMVDAAISGDIIINDIDISQENDSIRIGDGVDLITATNSDGKTGLDVNIINDIELNIDQDSDSISIGDGEHLFTSTQVGSKVALDVNVISAEEFNIVSRYDEISAVVSGIEVIILSYIVPTINQYNIQKVEFAGTNIARYTLKVNGISIDRTYTYFGGNLFASFDFGQGLRLNPGDEVTVEVIHNRPSMGDFNTRLQLMEKIV